MNPSQLVGREHELERLVSLLATEPGAGRAILVLGDPGIGKTSLLEAAAYTARQRGFRVLKVTGVQAEAQIPFAAMHQMLRPIEPELGHLPDNLREALLNAFGIGQGAPPDHFQIYIALGTLLDQVAVDTPLAVIADDIQWLDPPTHDALSFVARQSRHNASTFIFSARKGFGGRLLSADLPVLDIAGLDDTASRTLLHRHSGELSEAQRGRILQEALGNPLALVELPKLRRGPHLHVPETPRPDLPLTARLERTFSSRLEELPQQTRTALLIAALDAADELEEILSATTSALGDELAIDILEPAATVGLISFDSGRLEFRHPLVRSAILEMENLDRRQAAHAALAAVLPNDPHRSTWHRAMSIFGPDDEVADALEGNAQRSISRGAVVAAISELQRASQLTTDPARRAHRLLVAAEYAFGLGQAEVVHALVDEASRYEPIELDRARLEWLREIFHDGVPGDPIRVHELCNEAQKASASADFDLALSLLLGAALRCWWADTGPEARARVVTVTRRMHGSERDPRYIAARAVAEPVLEARDIIRELSQVDTSTLVDPNSLRLLGMAAHAIGDSVRATDLFDSAERALREQGRLGLLLHVLGIQVNVRLELGDLKGAEAALDEGQRIAALTDQPIWDTGTVVTGARAAGLRGDVEQALRLAAQGRRAAGRHNDHLCCAQLAFGIAYLAAGDHQQAYKSLRRMFDPADPSYHWRESFSGLMPLAEAARPAHQLDDAREVLAKHERIARLTPSPILSTHLLYARAVLADDNSAEQLFRSALSENLTRWTLTRAKIELEYGNWLLRHNRLEEARSPLRSASSTLMTIGAQPWAERARIGLTAIG